MKPKLIRRKFGVGFVIIGIAVAAMFVPVSGASANLLPPGGDGGALAKAVASWANKEYSNVDGHKYEKPLGGNCNYFSGALGVGSTVGDDGRSCNTSVTHYRSEEWCADFAKWVYKKAGASVTNLTPAAHSAENYATYQTVSSGRRPRVGDLALWADPESHVGIVVSVDSSGVPTVVSGNSTNPGHGFTAINKQAYAVSKFQGFAAPLYA